MRNFQLIGTFDPVPLLNQINRNPQLWNQNLLRTTHENTPHKDVDDIWVRFNDAEKYTKDNQYLVLDEHESIWYPAIEYLPAVRDIVFSLMAKVHGVRLGRVLITRLPPGKEITPHSDSGSHASYFERYHCVLQSLPGSLFRCGDEQINMLTGTIWWFQNIIEHSVVNNSADDRIHLIVDIKC
jgi:hypothetical protein